MHVYIVQFTPPELPGYVGFANLPNQVHRKSVKRGFEFTLMVVGELTWVVWFYQAMTQRLMIDAYSAAFADSTEHAQIVRG